MGDRMTTGKKSRILCIGGSLNQTMIVHKIAACMPEAECWFTPFFAEGLEWYLQKFGLLDHTIMGGAHRRATMEYLTDHHLPVDEGGQNGFYDLVITCTDLIVQPSLRHSRIVLVQEGITEEEGLIYPLVQKKILPRVFANTAATGLSDVYEKFCVASPGYRSLFIRKGVKPEKIVVTGIPNFDHADAYRKNNFPYRQYVLVATSSIRETFGQDDRMSFLQQTRQIVGNLPVIFKLHPNEDQARAEREIRQVFPGSLIFHEGNLHEMIANCEIFVAQNTSAVYTAAALKKKTYSYISSKKIKRLMPIQNGGTSAQHIAEVCRHVLNTPPHNDRLPVIMQRRSLLWNWLAGS